MTLAETEDSPSFIHQEANYQPGRSWRTWLIGRPLSTADAPHQTIGKAIGLAVFASDALSSTAYATQEIMVVLAAAGTMAFGLVFPISLAIVVLLVIVTISYEQTIHAYPGGGGAYIVARDNLGELPAQTAGAALLTDYILTVAVSISSGVAQITSAFPVADTVSCGNLRRDDLLYHADQPAGGEGVGSCIRPSHLFFHPDDVHDGGHRSRQILDRLAWPGDRSTPSWIWPRRRC